jgi:hypothetical protein
MTALGDISDVDGQKPMANSLPVVIASDQSTLPVSAASLPLPTGAATSANQTDGSQRTKITDGTNNVAVSSSPPTGTEQGLIVRNIPSGTQTVAGTVSVNILPAGDNNIGNVDVASLPAPLNVTGSGAAASSLRVQLADESLTALENTTATVVNPVVSGETTFLKTSPVDTENDWITVKSWASDTVIPTFNTRPAAGDFVALTGIHPSTQIIYQVPKIKTNPTLNVTPHLWVDDGQEVYLVASTAVAAKTSSLSGLDLVSPYDGSAPLAVTLNRYTPNIKVATAITASAATLTYTVNGTSTATITAPAAVFNVGFVGGEQVRLTTTSQLPLGLAGTFASIDTATDTFTLNNVQFADGEEVRVNLIQLAATAAPPLGLAGLGRSANIDLGEGWLELDSGYNLNLQPGDIVRFRAGASSTLPSLAGTAIAANTSYTVTEVSGQKFKITLSTHGSATFAITAPGAGIFYVFKYPYIDLFAKGTNQLSSTVGGAAIDFKRQHDNVAITITPGTAATITHNAHPFVNGQEVLLTATTVPTGSFQGQRFYVKNAALNTYNLSLTAAGPAVAFTSAGTAVQIVDPAAGTAYTVTVAAGTPGSILLPAHWLGATSDFILGGTTLPSDYTSGKALYVITPTANTFTFSENKVTPMVLADAGTSVTLSTIPGRNSDVMLERRTVYIASSPAPTDTTVSFAYTSGGSAITLAGGSGTQTFTAIAAPTIKAGSYIKVRAT